VSSVLCFFMLFTNTDAVVRESLWELGVLRALGLSSAQLLRVAVYEALASTLAAVALGAAAGLAVAATLSAQSALFTELPVRLAVPWGLVLASLAAALAAAALGAYRPVRAAACGTIARIIKGA
jgi:putative ABC transport system permease protein